MKMDLGKMEVSADMASDLLKALANKHRLMLVCQLVDGERAVGELARALELRDSTVSQHLALLRKDGIVRARREGQTIYYSIGSPAAHAVLEVLYAHFCAPTALCGPRDTADGRKSPGGRSRQKAEV
jgi:DNA-binding transcriptional ArsR family regulator